MMHSLYYEPSSKFFVTFAVHERENNYDPFVLTSIENMILGLHDFLKKKKEAQQCTTDGEIALELLSSLGRLRGDGSEHKLISIINWWKI